MDRRRVASAAVVVAVIISGCSSSPHARVVGPPTTPAVASPVGSGTASPAPVNLARLERTLPPGTLGFPRTIEASPDPATDPGGGLAWLRPGTTVPSQDIRSRVHLGAGVEAGLADQGTLFGFAYPALSRDGGRSWRVDGPQFYHAGADGPGTTTQLVSLADVTLIAWGQTGNLVKTSGDLGRHWVQALFSGGVLSLRVVGSEIIVRATGDALPPGSQTGPLATWIYRSTDGGQRWHRRQAANPWPS